MHRFLNALRPTPFTILLFVAVAAWSLFFFGVTGGQRFFFDRAGIEGMEWYVFWCAFLSIGMLPGFGLFTAVLVIRNALRSGGDSGERSPAPVKPADTG